VILSVFVDVFDRVSLAEKAEQINREYLLVGEVRIGIVALPLHHSAQASVSVMTANEQIDPDEHMLPVHVAKGGLDGRCLVAPSSNRPRRRGFSTLNRHYIHRNPARWHRDRNHPAQT